MEDRETNTFTRLDEVNSEYKVTLTEVANGVGKFHLHTEFSILSTNNLSSINI